MNVPHLSYKGPDDVYAELNWARSLAVEVEFWLKAMVN